MVQPKTFSYYSEPKIIEDVQFLPKYVFVSQNELQLGDEILIFNTWYKITEEMLPTLISFKSKNIWTFGLNLRRIKEN